MINVKSFVIFILFAVDANSSEYCKICRNHTLCKYPVPGPSKACVGYDVAAQLTRDDIIRLVNRINERRNFVALGLSKRFPTAANMRKISWSEDLAWSAQRWVDQCDVSVRPDNHDLCRNLEDKAVGQSIATIFGPTTGLSIKSFVDVWFMQTLDYSGDVSFYNQSRDAKTKYFTQLIWAETDSVGCGKARFQVEYNIEVERLVCNFAPSGNIHGKPIYAIGVPATQCPDNCKPDDKYTGLCNYQTLSKIFMSEKPPVPSLLQILNLANNSLKKETYPLKNNLSQSSIDVDENHDHRHHKSRHVFNSSQVESHHYLQQRPPQWNSFNDSRDFLIHNYQPERRQPLVYHGHNHRGNVVPPYTVTSEPNFRRFDLITQPNSPPSDTQSNVNYRKFNQYNQCTRRSPVLANCNSAMPCFTDKCTRGQYHGCGVTLPCISNVQSPHVFPHNQCPSTTCPPPPCYSPCCETTCHCPCHVTNPSPCCVKSGVESSSVEDRTVKDARKASEIHYYDLFPNLALRNAESTSEKPLNKINIPTDKKMWLLRNVPSNREKNKVLQLKRRDHQISKNCDQVKHEIDLPNYMEEERDYPYTSFNSRIRQKREPDDKITYKPFWQINDYENQDTIIMKSLHYTTLRNKKNRNTWRITPNRMTSTEPITIELQSHSKHDEYTDFLHHGTEKYLSFDELLHLRKMNSDEFNARRLPFVGRRQAKTTAKATTKKATTAKPVTVNQSKTKDTAKTKHKLSNVSTPDKSTTTEKLTTKQSTTKQLTTKQTTTKKVPSTTPKDYSVNTPFQRKKYCTRRLTCTWTAFTATASDGSIINVNPGGGGGGGSRTPPGYVEGCTRTSTCTRDFMNRNKISTLPMSTIEGQETLEDEDYCERRSLNVQRRNSDEKPERERIVKRQEFYKSITLPIIIGNKTLKPENLLNEALNVCNCAVEDIRMKRNAINNNILRSNYYILKNEEQYKNPLMSYGDLYYQVINKLLKTWQKEKINRKCGKCPCSASSHNHNMSITYILVWLITLNKFCFINDEINFVNK